MSEAVGVKNVRLKNMPDDIRAIILNEQVRLKIECKCTKSQETTIYSLIRKAVKQ